MYENDFIKLESEIEDLKIICKDFQIMLKYSDNKDIICDLVQEKVIEKRASIDTLLKELTILP